ncbi:hypothetical protein C0991_006686 [Blastosporella zonata]|nr:hypothetical protein C0991_006686 [Blastosporella zonata]
MAPNDPQEMPVKKRRRVMDVPDGFQRQKPAEAAKASIQIPKFTSAFDEKQPQTAQRKPVPKQKFDPTSDFVIPKAVAATLNKPKSHTNLKQLAVPAFPPHMPEKEKTALPAFRLQSLADPRALTTVEAPSETTPHLLRLPPPPPTLPNAGPSKLGPMLKNLPAPTMFAPAETTLDPSMRTISTTDIALATDLFTESGAAELAHIFLHDQHPEIAAFNKQAHPEWNIGMSPQKGVKYVKGKGKEAKFVKGGLAARSFELISQSHTSLTLWQKETELQLASSSSRLNSDLRLRIVKIIEPPAGAKSSSPRKPSFAANSATSTAVAICRVVSTPSRHPHVVDYIPRIREKQYHLVVLTFATIAPPRLRGRNGVYVRNPEDFIAGRELCLWQPWHEVSLSSKLSSSSPDDSATVAADSDETGFAPAPFPTLPSTYPPPPSLQTNADTMIALSPNVEVRPKPFSPVIDVDNHSVLVNPSLHPRHVLKSKVPPPTIANEYRAQATWDGFQGVWLDENLLLLLHGLGDTHLPFSNLGRHLKLPQTAALALRAPERVPFLYEEAFQWYTSFDELGEIIERPNPTPALDLLEKVVKRLVDACGWPSHRIHLFGFAQGGSVAAEFGIKWWKQHLASQASVDSPSGATKGTLGSVISISGPLLSYPTLSVKNPTPALIVHALPPSDMPLPSGAIPGFKKAYSNLTEKTSKEALMPSSKVGWEPIMQFWSTHLGRRQLDGLYEVMSGSVAVPR